MAVHSAMQLGDTESRAVAHNHVAVAHQKLADHMVANASSSTLPTTAQVRWAASSLCLHATVDTPPAASPQLADPPGWGGSIG